MKMEAEGGDGSRNYNQRQLEVELNAVILAAGHTGRSNIVDRLKDLRGVWLGYAKYEQEREAKEVALLREVERVDRAAAKVAIETERLKRLRDEAMEVVRKVEPGLIDTPPPSRPLSSRSITQDDLLFLNKDLKNVRDLILNDNLREDDLKLTDLVGKSSAFKRRGSYGSLLQSSVMSRDIKNDKTMHSNMPPPMPLMNNWGGYQTHNFAPHHQQYPPQHPQYPAEGYPHYQEAYGQPPQYYDAYGNVVPLNVQPTPYTQLRPNYNRDYPPPPPGHQSSMQRSPQPYHNPYGSGPHLNMPHHQNGYVMENSNQRYERDMSTDEGENTSNDAGDISSSEASGSGRRRKNKSMSPKSPVHAKQNDSTESKSNPDQGNSSRKSDYVSPEKTVTKDIKHQPKTSTPKKELLVEKMESPKLDVIRKDNSPKKVKELKEELKLSPSLPKQSISNVKEGVTSDLPKEKIQEKVSDVIPTEICNDQNENKKDIKIDTVSNPVAIDQNYTTESGDEDAKLYSSESDTSSQEVLPAKKVSAERERKVGMGPQNTTNAYQQMLMGGSKKPPVPVTIDDESTSDDLEAQFAVMAKPKNTFRSANGSSLHNIDDQSLSDFQPKPSSNLQKQAAKPTTKMTGSLGGGMGHPMPLSFAMGSKPAGLSGGKLGHPAAQKMGLLALNTETEDGGEEDLSAPENEEEDDFWS